MTTKNIMMDEYRVILNPIKTEFKKHIETILEDDKKGNHFNPGESCYVMFSQDILEKGRTILGLGDVRNGEAEEVILPHFKHWMLPVIGWLRIDQDQGNEVRWCLVDERWDVMVRETFDCINGCHPLL